MHDAPARGTAGEKGTRKKMYSTNDKITKVMLGVATGAILLLIPAAFSVGSRLARLETLLERMDEDQSRRISRCEADIDELELRIRK